MEEFFNYYLNTERIDKESYSICKLTFIDKILMIPLFELFISFDDILRIEDMIYSYICFGGYNVNMVCDFNSQFSHYQFQLMRDPKDSKDIFSIIEVKGNIKVSRIKFEFNDDMDYRCNGKSIFDLYHFFYDSLLSDKIPLSEIAPDFVYDEDF